MSEYDSRKHLKELEEAKKAVRCPRVREARESLFLTVPQFCELLGISKGDYYDMESGSRQLSHGQRLFLVTAIELAKKAGLIVDNE